MPFKFAAKSADPDAQQHREMTPAHYQALQLQLARDVHRDTHAIEFDGTEARIRADGSAKVIRQRPVRFIVEAHSASDDRLVLRCLNGITGHECWFADDIFEIMSGPWGCNRARFLVCGGRFNSIPQLTVDFAEVFGYLRRSLEDACSRGAA